MVEVLGRLGAGELRGAGSLRNGNRAEVSVEVNGKVEKILAAAVPEFKQINLCSLDGKAIKRETHMNRGGS